MTAQMPGTDPGIHDDGPFSVKDKVIWVTGASKGITAAVARGLAAGGEHPSHGPRLLSRVPMSRFAAANEMAGSVQFLLSDAASYMTGAVLEIDGGWTSP